MARRPARLPWQFDEKTQTFTTPAGKVTLQELAEARYALGVCRIDLTGPWAGWRISGDALKPPRGPGFRVKPRTAALFARWLQEAAERDAAMLGTAGAQQRPAPHATH